MNPASEQEGRCAVNALRTGESEETSSSVLWDDFDLTSAEGDGSFEDHFLSVLGIGAGAGAHYRDGHARREGVGADEFVFVFDAGRAQRAQPLDIEIRFAGTEAEPNDGIA
jgi:hypothetical protein